MYPPLRPRPMPSASPALTTTRRDPWPSTSRRAGPRAPDRGQRLERGLTLVEVARGRGRLHHRVLAGDVVGRTPGSRSGRAPRGPRRGRAARASPCTTSAPSSRSSAHSRSASARWRDPSGTRGGRRTRAPTRPPRGTGRRRRRRTWPRRRRSASRASAARIAATRPSIMSLGAHHVGSGLDVTRPPCARAARASRRSPPRRRAGRRSDRATCTRTGRRPSAA